MYSHYYRRPVYGILNRFVYFLSATDNFMLTPIDVRKKALSSWNSGRILGAVARNDEDFFPLRLAWGRPTAKQLSNDFSAIRERIAEIKQHAGPDNMGYTIEWQEINHRRFGRQQIPAALLFSLEGFLHCTGRKKAFQQFVADLELIRSRHPILAEWLSARPMTVVKQAGKWPQLLLIVEYFKTHPQPDLYLRQLDIAGVDSKFIEQHKKILTDLLDLVLPATAVDQTVTGLAHHGFERRYGLKFDEPLIRLRFLDPSRVPAPGCTDLTLPLSGFTRLQPACSRVIITENKINGLSFPPVPDSVIIFGLGYGIHSLADTDWLQDKDIYYWGDIDTHGFSILSLVRSFLPQTRSFLMDRETLLDHRSLWGQEENSKRCLDTLLHLTPAEQTLYDELKNNTLALNVRLEQERISFSRVRQVVHHLLLPAQ